MVDQMADLTGGMMADWWVDLMDVTMADQTALNSVDMKVVMWAGEIIHL